MQHGFSGVVLLFVVLIIGAITGICIYKYNFLNIRQINSFYDCDNAGFRDPKANPPVCITPNGQYYSWLDVIDQPSFKSSIPESSDKTSNWKIYQGNGFEFRYPVDWGHKLTPINDYYYISIGEMLDINHVGQKVDPYPGNMVSLTVKSRNKGQTIEEVMNLVTENTKWTDITISGLPAKKIEHVGCVSAECMDIVFANDEFIYDFSVNNSSKAEYQNYLMSVAGTFKFTNN